MEEIAQAFTAVGALGVIFALGVSSLFFLVQPIWAIIDCIDSDRDRDAKILVGVALFFTWAFGGLLYGLFFASSSSLRKFTVVMLLLLLALLVGSVATCSVGAVKGAKAVNEREAVEQAAREQRAAAFAPPVETRPIAPFHALLNVAGRTGPSAVSVAEFGAGGPVFSTARDVSQRIRQVTWDPRDDRFFALTSHDFGAISPSTGQLTKIEVDPTLEEDFSWPRGLAYDTTRNRVVVMTTGGGVHFFVFDPRSVDWRQLPSVQRGLDLRGLAYEPEQDALYAAVRPDREQLLTHLQRFNAQGANLGTLALEPAIPLSPAQEDIQVHASSGKLVLVLPRYKADARGLEVVEGQRVFLVDPASGAVTVAKGSHPVSNPEGEGTRQAAAPPSG